MMTPSQEKLIQLQGYLVQAQTEAANAAANGEGTGLSPDEEAMLGALLLESSELGAKISSFLKDVFHEVG